MHYNVYFFTCEFEVSGLLRAGLDDLCLRNHAAFQMSSFRSLYITYTISMTYIYWCVALMLNTLLKYIFTFSHAYNLLSYKKKENQVK